MSSHEDAPSEGASRRGVLRGLVFTGAASVLSACGFRPLYEGGVAVGVAGELPAIAIDDPSTRLEQAVRNELVFLFTGGSAPAAPRYRMTLAVSGYVTALTFQQTTGRPTDSTFNLIAAVTLTDVATGATVLTETFRTAAAFEQTTQRFANQRAELDASQRAARDVAATIRTRVAVALRA